MQTSLSAWAQLLQSSPLVWVAVVFVFSLLVGSFLNVVIHRVPIMLERDWRASAEEILAPATPPTVPGKATDAPARFNLLVPRSACPKCNALITASQNIPVVSYLLLGGKCANCSAPISRRYPLVELATAVLSAAVAWKYGCSWQAAAALLLTWMLISLSLIDFDHQLLPDSMTLSLLWIGLLLSLAGPSAGHPLPVDSRSSLLGAAAGYVSLWSVYQAFKLLTGKEGMGYGDFKLFAALGAWMGWKMLLPIILLSASTGAVIGGALIVTLGRDRNIPFSFGPYLAAAGWIALMWGPELVHAYLKFSHLA